MAVFWEHNENLDAPPELGDLRWRRPGHKHYWESGASDKPQALANFWIRWKRETGKEYPRKPPSNSSPTQQRGFTGTRNQASRRPVHHSEKDQQPTV